MPDLVQWTREQVLSLPEDGNRYELLDGALLVTPSPRMAHQVMVTVFLLRLANYVESAGIGRVIMSPADLFGRRGQLLQPDLFVVPTRTVAESWDDVPDPILVVEVLSPSTARHDRITKRRFYLRAGGPEYWIVDVDARMVERWRPGDERPEILDQDLRWQPREDVPPLLIDLPGLFAELDA